MPARNSNLADTLISHFDRALRTLVPGSAAPQRASPAVDVAEAELSEEQRRHAAGLMRVNHCGEVCAQALYQGQALTARLPEVREGMEEAAREEIDHLSWCEQRLQQLGSRPSITNPLWYSLSYGLGALAGAAGDRWSLGFVAETEDQVCEHLRSHLDRLPPGDALRASVLRAMLEDEARHADNARAAGAARLPFPVRTGMRAMASVMKATTYRI